MQPVTVDCYHHFVMYMVHTGEVLEDGAAHLFAFQAFTQVTTARPSVRIEEGRMLIIWEGAGITLVYEVDPKAEAFGEYCTVVVPDPEFGSVSVLCADEDALRIYEERADG